MQRNSNLCGSVDPNQVHSLKHRMFNHLIIVHMFIGTNNLMQAQKKRKWMNIV